jgi:hypothetical protein
VVSARRGTPRRCLARVGRVGGSRRTHTGQHSSLRSGQPPPSIQRSVQTTLWSIAHSLALPNTPPPGRARSTPSDVSLYTTALAGRLHALAAKSTSSQLRPLHMLNDPVRTSRGAHAVLLAGQRSCFSGFPDLSAFLRSHGGRNPPPPPSHGDCDSTSPPRRKRGVAPRTTDTARPCSTASHLQAAAQEAAGPGGAQGALDPRLRRGRGRKAQWDAVQWSGWKLAVDGPRQDAS